MILIVVIVNRLFKRTDFLVSPPFFESLGLGKFEQRVTVQLLVWYKSNIKITTINELQIQLRTLRFSNLEFLGKWTAMKAYILVFAE